MYIGDLLYFLLTMIMSVTRENGNNYDIIIDRKLIINLHYCFSLFPLRLNKIGSLRHMNHAPMLCDVLFNRKSLMITVQISLEKIITTSSVFIFRKSSNRPVTDVFLDVLHLEIVSFIRTVVIFYVFCFEASLYPFLKSSNFGKFSRRFTS